MTGRLVAAVAVAAAACHHGGADAARPGAARLDLLGGRLGFTPPAGAEAQPRGHSLMAADPSAEEESRVILVPGAGEYARFVLMATETFATLDDDPARRAAQVRAWALPGDTVGEVALADGSTAIEFVNHAPARRAPLRVYGALVPMADHTAIELAYYIMPADADDRDAWAAQARALTGTVVRGGAPLAHAARTAALESLAIDVPDGAVVTAQPGPDFAVYRLRLLAPLGAPAAEAGIYLGLYPSYQHSQADIADADVQREPGTLLGLAVEWHRWAADGVEVREAMATRADGGGEVHAFRIAPPGDPRAAALDAALATLRLATSTSR